MKTMRACKLDGCEKRHEALGLCKYHYSRHHRGLELTDIADRRLKYRKVIGSRDPYKP